MFNFLRGHPSVSPAENQGSLHYPSFGAMPAIVLSDPGMTFSSLSPSDVKRSNAEDDVQGLAVYKHGLVLGDIRAWGNGVVLVPLVALQLTQIKVSLVFNVRLGARVRMPDEQHMQDRAVGDAKLLDPQKVIAVGQKVDSGLPASYVEAIRIAEGARADFYRGLVDVWHVFGHVAVDLGYALHDGLDL